MPPFITKSDFMLKTSEYLDQVESLGEEVVITDRGRPVIRIVPFVHKALQRILDDLRGSVVVYKKPMEPVELRDWKAPGFKPASRKGRKERGGKA